MPRKRARNPLLSLSPCRKSLRCSSLDWKPELERRQPHEQPLSPQSSGSSLLSSPPNSDDLHDPFQTGTVDLGRQRPKKNIDQVDVPEYKGFVTKSGAKHQSPNKRRKVHFQDESLAPKSRRLVTHHPQVVSLSALDALNPLTKKPILTKSDSSKKQKAWSRKYISARDCRTEAIENLKSALGPEFEGSRASTPASSFVSNTPSKRGRGNGRRGRGRGRGGRGRGGGRAGRNEDSPEPPKKKIITEAEREVLADLKARQTELKKFFKEVGVQQIEALNLLATQDLGKIVKKSKAHERVPEYQALANELDQRKKDAENYAKGKYEYDLQQANFLLEAEKEVIKQRYQVGSSQTLFSHLLKSP